MIAKGNTTLQREIQESWYAPITPSGKDLLKKLVPWGDAAVKSDNLTFNDVYFHALGSSINPNASVIVVNEIKAMKSMVWVSGESSVSNRKRMTTSDLERQYQDFRYRSQEGRSVRLHPCSKDYLPNMSKEYGLYVLSASELEAPSIDDETNN